LRLAVDGRGREIVDLCHMGIRLLQENHLEASGKPAMRKVS
jgi:hypothetical protein